jgi:hypothetical protein
MTSFHPSARRRSAASAALLPAAQVCAPTTVVRIMGWRGGVNESLNRKFGTTVLRLNCLFVSVISGADQVDRIFSN